MNREEFNIELLKADTPDKKSTFIQRHLVHGVPYVFNGDENKYFDFRNRIAKRFGVQYQEVFIVGSSKLGFSYQNNTEFSLESDIDVVIVNEQLFDKYQIAISDYQYELDKFYQTRTIGEMQQYEKFMKYFIKGWMRPDYIPTSFSIELLRDEWFQFFRTISNGKSEVGNYRVSGGLFKNMLYFEKYHLQSINREYEKLNL